MHDPRESHFALTLLSLAANHMSWLFTQMLIGSAAQTPISPPLDIVCFLAIILYHGPPSTNTLSRGQVLKSNTGVLLMLWPRLAGFVNSSVSFTILEHVLLLYIVTTSVVFLSNPIHHQRTKHMEIDLDFIREHVALGVVRVLHVPTSLQSADIFTKGLPTAVFINFQTSLDIRSSPG